MASERLVFRPHPALRVLRVVQLLTVVPIATSGRSTVAAVLAVATFLLLVACEVLERIVIDEAGVTMPHRLWRRAYCWSEISTLGATRGDDRLTLVLADGSRHRLRWVPKPAYERIPVEWLAAISPEQSKAPVLPEA